MRLLTVSARLVRPELADRVVAPSMDATTQREQEAMRAREPLSFLHAMHPPGPDAVERGRQGLARLLEAGAFGERFDGRLFVYRLTDHAGSETGIVGALPARAFGDGGEVLSHEDTRPDVVAHLAASMRELRVVASPVKAAFRASPQARALLGELTARPPDRRAGDRDDVIQELWSIDDPDPVQRVLAEVDRAYIIDGHHRSAAALELGPDTPVLTALFPHDEVHVAGFDRVVRPAGDLGPLLGWLASVGAERRDGAAQVVVPGTVRVWVDGTWWAADLPAVEGEPPATLDPAVLQDVVLGPLFGIDDPTSDPRLDFVPGALPRERLTERAGSDGVAFALAPVAMEDVMWVADRGRSMPPKSTYFHPKPRSGLLLMEL